MSKIQVPDCFHFEIKHEYLKSIGRKPHPAPIKQSLQNTGSGGFRRYFISLSSLIFSLIVVDVV